jgi:uncharacterized protein YdaU (DUF1376 family)
LFEDLAYRRMLDAYYLAERPFNGCSTDVARLIGMRDHLDAVEYVLNTYFEKTETGWCNARADAEIEKFKVKQEQAARAGRASVQRRMNGRSTDVEQPLNEILTDVQPTKNQEPRTKNHIKDSVAKATVSSPPEDVLACPIEKIIDLYHQTLQSAPRVLVRNATRDGLIRQRWRDCRAKFSTQDEGLEFFREFFQHVGTSKFLTGRVDSTNRAPFIADLEWLMRPTNFAKTVEGRYHR